MTFTDSHIVDAYAGLFEGLKSASKMKLIERLSKSLKAGDQSKENLFYKSFGAFNSSKSAEEIIEEIRSSRKFIEKDIKL